MLRKTIKLLIIVVIMLIIFLFSSDTGTESSIKSDDLIIKATQIIMNRQLTTSEKEKITKLLVVPIRKTAHIIIYLLLGISIISFYKEFKTLNVYSVINCLIICILYAISDEVHQMFVVGRSGELKDVIIDSVGSIFGILSYYKIYLGRKKTHE